MLLKLTTSNFAHRKVRVALTVLAVTLAVSLVVSVTSGYASLRAAAFHFLNQYIGSIDAQIMPRDASQSIDPAIADQIRGDRDVREVFVRLEGNLQIGRELAPPFGRVAQIKGIERPQDREVEKLPLLTGAWFDGDSGNFAVIDQVAAQMFGVAQGEGDAATYEIGKTITLPGFGRTLDVQVVGVIRKPSFLAQANPAIYLPLKTFQAFSRPDEPNAANRILIALHPGGDAQAFAERWTQRLEAIDPDLRLRLASDTRQQMSQNMRGLEILSYLGGAVSLLAATFIVFSSLSMGVSERARTLAMLRAVGAYRSQLAALVVTEGVILAGAGALIGVPLGLLWVKLLAIQFPTFFIDGVTVGWGGVLLGSAGSVLAALLASLLPALMAMRTDPLEAMTPLAKPPRSAVPAWALVSGLLLVAIDPFFMLGPWDWLAAILGIDPLLTRQVKFYSHFALGLPGVMVGFFLLAPAFVWLIERLLGRVIALVHGVRYPLLRQQLAGGLWRAAGTAAALMVGLSVLVVMQTQGNSALAGWKLPTRFPDLFIVSPFQPLDEKQVAILDDVPGLRKGEVMPLAIAAPGLRPGFWSITGVAILPDATMFIGMDPDKAFELMELDFRDANGNSTRGAERKRMEDYAREKLKLGRHVIITEEFRQLKNLGIGDTIMLKTTRSGEVPYTVAGVVWSPGLDVIVGMYDLDKTFDQRTANSLFGTLEDARRDFGVEGYEFFVANAHYGAEREDVLNRIKEAVGKWSMGAYDIRHIKHAIEEAFRQLLMLTSTVALAAMTVASLGVTNTLMASVRSRQWQFGILRSVGLTRGHLLRIVLAEAVLLGLIGVAMGVTAGLLMSINARALSATLIGYRPDIDIPWDIVGFGAAVIILIAVLASLWPAIATARQQPLALLQAGRAAT